MRGIVVIVGSCLVFGCGPEGAMGLDASSIDGGQDTSVADAFGLDGGPSDAPASDAWESDAPDPDDGGSDAGDFDGHVVRLANAHGTVMSVELCIYPDGIASAPVRMMDALGRSAGLGHLEVSARYAFVPVRASVPIRVVDALDGDCETPLFETTITGSRQRVLFVLGTSSFVGSDDATPAPAANDLWRHVHHEGGSGVFSLVHGDGSEQRPSTVWAEASGSGMFTYRNSDGDLLFSRSFTAAPGGAFSTFSLQPSLTEVSIVICDDRAAPIDGLTECGASVRP
jgi:hypothetical protein